MSNRLYIEPTIFTNQRTEIVTYGVRVYDDYFSSYDNTWESIPTDDMDVLSQVINENNNVEIGIALDDIEANKQGLDIGGSWYDWDKIKHLFE